jgi:hypothetical protein
MVIAYVSLRTNDPSNGTVKTLLGLLIAYAICALVVILGSPFERVLLLIVSMFAAQQVAEMLCSS